MCNLLEPKPPNVLAPVENPPPRLEPKPVNAVGAANPIYFKDKNKFSFEYSSKYECDWSIPDVGAPSVGAAPPNPPNDAPPKPVAAVFVPVLKPNDGADVAALKPPKPGAADVAVLNPPNGAAEVAAGAPKAVRNN